MLRKICACTSSAVFMLLLSSLSVVSQSPPDRTRIAELEQYLNKFRDKEFSGAIVIVKDGQLIFAKGHGLADRERNLPNTSRTVFEIGSTSKQFIPVTNNARIARLSTDVTSLTYRPH
jgi:CubicO group peptidase (beta-lactamase class C family)